MTKQVINEYFEQEEYFILKIANTKNIIAETFIDKDDYDKIRKYKWTLSVHGADIRIVANTAKLNRCYLHQFIIGAVPQSKVIDHINRNPLDNRKNNLRIVNRSINSTNAKARSESKTMIRGVYLRPVRPKISKEAWVCEWSINGKRYSKSFSIEKYGYEKAFEMALSLRERKMKELKI